MQDLDRDTVQEILLGPNPVIVVGPGCQRVGYDTGPGWEVVTQRLRRLATSVREVERESQGSSEGMPPPGDDRCPGCAIKESSVRAYLTGFWRDGLAPRSESLQDEHMRRNGIFVDGDASDAPILEGVRTYLGHELLLVLSETTKCLGLVIASGETPVRRWQDVQARRGTTFLTDPDAQHEAAKSLNRAAEAWRRIRDFSRELANWAKARDANNADASAVRALLEAPAIKVPVTSATDDGLALKNGLFDLRISSIHKHAEMLMASHFASPADKAISGATVEWISDLLWHIVSCGSGVPPSQGATAFYLNLVDDPRPTDRAFTRPRPGEYRGQEPPTKNLRRLLTTYDAGLDETSCRDSRYKLYRTLAATLAEQWARKGMYPNQEPESALDGVVKEYVVAIVASYDLAFERQMTEVLNAGEGFHTVVPVWVGEGSGTKELRWLMGGYTKQPTEKWTASHLAGPPEQSGFKLGWRWCDDSAFTAVRGPVIVKPNGSPLLRLSANGPATLQSLGLASGPKQAQDHEVVPAAIVSEYDTVTSIVGMAQDEQRGAFGGASAKAALSWNTREWLFLGDGFPEWLSRLRVVFQAHHDRKTEKTKSAIDRGFDWPELALLETLKVQPLKGDLEVVANYTDEPSPGSEKDLIDAINNRCAP